MKTTTAEHIAAASLASAISGRRLAPPVRLGLLGASRAAERIVRAAAKVPSLKITAIASRSFERAERLLEQAPDAGHVIYDDLLASRDVDAVYVSLPNSLHHEWALKAINAGKHVLIEKPASPSARQAEELADAAEDRGVLAMEAMWYRFHSQTTFLRDLVLSGGLGALRAATSSCGYMKSDPADIRWNKGLGGGAIADLFCYHADFMTYVLGIKPEDVVRVEAFARYRNEVPASVQAELTTRAGATLSFTVSIERDSSNRTAILGRDGACDVPDLRVFPEMEGCEILLTGRERRRTFEREDAYANMLLAFVEGIRGNHELLMPLSDTRANLEIAAMVEKACRVEMADRTALLPRLNSATAEVWRKLVGTAGR